MALHTHIHKYTCIHVHTHTHTHTHTPAKLFFLAAAWLGTKCRNTRSNWSCCCQDVGALRGDYPGPKMPNDIILEFVDDQKTAHLGKDI